MPNRSDASWRHHLLVVGIALLLNSSLAMGLIRLALAQADTSSVPAMIEVTVLPPPVVRRVPPRVLQREVAVQDALPVPDEVQHEDPPAPQQTPSDPIPSTPPLPMPAAPIIPRHSAMPIEDTRAGLDRSHPPVMSPVVSVPLLVDNPLPLREMDREDSAPAPRTIISLTHDPDDGGGQVTLSPKASPARPTAGIRGGDGAPAGSHGTAQPGGSGPHGDTSGRGAGEGPGQGPGAATGGKPGNPGQGNGQTSGGGQPPSGTRGDTPKGESTGTAPAGSPTPHGGTPGDGTGTGKRVGARVTRDAQPAYPRDARRDGVEGTTVLRVSLDTKGRVTDVAVATSSGDTRLDDAAVRSVRTWKFSPATEDEKPVAASLRVRVQFRLD